MRFPLQSCSKQYLFLIFHCIYFLQICILSSVRSSLEVSGMTWGKTWNTAQLSHNLSTEFLGLRYSKTYSRSWRTRKALRFLRRWPAKDTSDRHLTQSCAKEQNLLKRKNIGGRLKVVSSFQMTPNWWRQSTGSRAELPPNGTCRVWRNGPQGPDEIHQGQMLRPTHGKGDHIVIILAGKQLCLKVLEQFLESELGEHEPNGTYWYWKVINWP